MRKIRCAKCGKEFVYEGQNVCPHCDQELNPVEIMLDILKKRKKVRHYVVILIVDVIVMFSMGRTTASESGFSGFWYIFMWLAGMALWGYGFIAFTCTFSWGYKLMRELVFEDYAPDIKTYDYDREMFWETVYKHYDYSTASGLRLLGVGLELLPNILCFGLPWIVSFLPFIATLRFMRTFLSINKWFGFIAIILSLALFSMLIIAYAVHAIYQWWSKERQEEVLSAMSEFGVEIDMSHIKPTHFDTVIDNFMRKLFAKTYEMKAENVVADPQPIYEPVALDEEKIEQN